MPGCSTLPVSPFFLGVGVAQHIAKRHAHETNVQKCKRGEDHSFLKDQQG